MTAVCCWLLATAILSLVATMARVPVDARVQFVLAFKDACRATGLSQKQVAALLEMSDRQLGQWLTVDPTQTQGNPNLLRLFMLKESPEGRAWLRVFWPALGCAYGAIDPAEAIPTWLVQFVNDVQVHGLDCAKTFLPSGATRQIA